MSQDNESAEPSKPEEARRSSPRLKIPVPPNLPLDDPEAGSPHRRLSTMVGVNFLLLLILVLMLGYVIHQQSKEPAPAENSAKSTDTNPANAVAGEVDRLKGEIAALTKKLGEMPAPPDPTPQIKLLDEKVADLGKSIGEMPGRLDSLAQKVEAASKGEGFAPAPKVDAIEKKVGELAESFDALKAGVATRPGPAHTTPPARVEDINVEGQAMEEAVDLFRNGKYAEAKDAFVKLQSVYPDDARVWYFSALANGLATRNWQGESERLVQIGVEKEKAGTPDSAKIDAVFADLTATNGRDWLAFYRKQAGR